MASGGPGAGPGESFVKIGVGVLEKGTSEEYLFDGYYRLRRPGTRRIEEGHHWISFEQVLDGERGWAYSYHKTIRLLDPEPGFAIDYRLENNGAKSIDTNHYNHNFTLIDGSPYGPDYVVEFAFGAGKPQTINDLAWFRDSAMVFWAVERAACPEPFFRIKLDPGESTTWSSSYRFSVDSD